MEPSMKQQEQHKKADSKKEFVTLLDEEEVEIKKLDSEDVADCVKVMRKCAFDVTEVEVKGIVDCEFSFAATVHRMIVGVGLAWPTKINLKSKVISSGDPNALYMEDPAVLLAYEGKGIRRILLKEREKAAISAGLSYSIAYLYEDVPQGSVADYLGEAGNQLEKIYLSENYEFHRTSRGVLALKKIS